MKKIEFVLPLEITTELSLNEIEKGSHWGGRSGKVRKIRESIRKEFLNQEIPNEIFEKPVHIAFKWNSRLDLDNHGYIAKVIIDTLKGRLIHNDTKKYVREITHFYWLGEGVKISICEYEPINTPNSNETL